MTITRMWQGWTSQTVADDYYFGELFPLMRHIEGFLGADALRRCDGDEVSFVTLTRSRSLDDIHAFAGEPLDLPVIEPRAAELLSRYEPRALHCETSTFKAA